MGAKLELLTYLDVAMIYRIIGLLYKRLTKGQKDKRIC